MNFAGRSRELGSLRSVLDSPTPQIVRVIGLPGVGKSSFARRAARDYDGLAFTCPPLPGPAQNAALAERLDPTGALEPTWEAAFGGALSTARAAERPWVLVLDEAHRLTDARARWIVPLLETLRAAAGTGTRLHVVLVGRESGLPDEQDLADTKPPLATTPLTTIPLAPLPLRIASGFLPGSEPHAIIRAYSVFGGIPGVLTQLDRSVTVGTNVRRLMLDRNGPLAETPATWLERETQTPPRYTAILRTLTRGEAEWATIHDGVPDLTSSGQVAPYLKKLMEVGLIAPRTSLDARPRSRSTRYALTDPFLAFWYRFVLPWRSGEEGHMDPAPLREHYAAAIRPAVTSHVGTIMPRIARQHMERDALETLGSSARECGGLWGPGYDIPVAGMLRSGAAFYGTCTWDRGSDGSAPLGGLEALDAQIGETRYGFGRERRIRLVFAGRDTPTALRREIARRPDAELIDGEALLG